VDVTEATTWWDEWLGRNGTRYFDMETKAGFTQYVDAAAREELPRVDRRRLEAMSGVERAAFDRARRVWNANTPIVNTPQMRYAFDVAGQVLYSSGRDGNRLRGSVALDSMAGVGKTTIAQCFVRDFAREQYRLHGRRTGPKNDLHQRLPVAYVSLTASTTLKALNQKLLEFYAHPAASKTTRARLEKLAAKCVRDCETRIIVIDDLHFVDLGQRNGLEVVKHLKSLANVMPVTFLYTGVQLREHGFFAEGTGLDARHAQTARRTVRCTVDAFTLETTAGRKAWGGVLTQFEEHLRLAGAASGMLTRHGQELFDRTQGHIGSLLDLISTATSLAISTGTEDITSPIIARAAVDSGAQAIYEHEHAPATPRSTRRRLPPAA
jgi:hypothetical protein